MINVSICRYSLSLIAPNFQNFWKMRWQQLSWMTSFEVTELFTFAFAYLIIPLESIYNWFKHFKIYYMLTVIFVERSFCWINIFDQKTYLLTVCIIIYFASHFIMNLAVCSAPWFNIWTRTIYSKVLYNCRM